MQNPSIENTVKANLAGETASSIELQFVPNYDTSTVYVKDIEIKAFNKKGTSDLNDMFLLRTYFYVNCFYTIYQLYKQLFGNVKVFSPKIGLYGN